MADEDGANTRLIFLRLDTAPRDCFCCRPTSAVACQVNDARRLERIDSRRKESIGGIHSGSGCGRVCSFSMCRRCAVASCEGAKRTKSLKDVVQQDSFCACIEEHNRREADTGSLFSLPDDVACLGCAYDVHEAGRHMAQISPGVEHEPAEGAWDDSATYDDISRGEGLAGGGMQSGSLSRNLSCRAAWTGLLASHVRRSRRRWGRRRERCMGRTTTVMGGT